MALGQTPWFFARAEALAMVESFGHSRDPRPTTRISARVAQAGVLEGLPPRYRRQEL